MTFREDPAFEGTLRRSKGFRAVLLANAENLADLARVIAPRRTNYYVDRIEAQKDAEGVRVTSTDPFAHIIEFGGPDVKSPTYAPLRRAADALFDDFVEEPKPV